MARKRLAQEPRSCRRSVEDRLSRGAPSRRADRRAGEGDAGADGPLGRRLQFLGHLRPGLPASSSSGRRSSRRRSRNGRATSASSSAAPPSPLIACYSRARQERAGRRASSPFSPLIEKARHRPAQLRAGRPSTGRSARSASTRSRSTSPPSRSPGNSPRSDDKTARWIGKDALRELSTRCKWRD